LTPAPISNETLQVNDVARQAGAIPITVPSEHPSLSSPIAEGEISPTGVSDLSIYPSWTDAKEPPSWYAKGGDIDALLDVGDTLDWLADSGDFNEVYQPLVLDINDSNERGCAATNGSFSTLPRVDSNVDSVVPALPPLFAGTSEEGIDGPDLLKSSSLGDLKMSTSTNSLDAHMHVFESQMEESDFVSTILENEKYDSLPALT
jgi:hypothetical protein